MSQKILLFVYFVGISQAIFIDPNKNLKKETYGNEEAKVFQMLNVYHPPQSHIHYKYESRTYPKYDFQYAVSDKKTGDHKQHRESRDGDCVRGEYSLVEPDGSVRKVEYNADSHNGFNAIVSKGVQKHGDHAYSIFDHTRHFYPIGHNIKINHYFPNKDENKNNKANLEKEIQPSPVQEEQDLKNEDDNMVVIDSGDKVMILKPIEETEINEVNDAIKVNTEETVIETSPSPSSEPTLSDIENKTEMETVPLKATVESNGELSEKDQNSIKNEHNDSEVASSYYHSRIYYMY